MLSFQGFAATILVADESGKLRELPQYAVQIHEEDNEVVCWIPAVDKQVKRLSQTLFSGCIFDMITIELLGPMETRQEPYL